MPRTYNKRQPQFDAATEAEDSPELAQATETTQEPPKPPEPVVIAPPPPNPAVIALQEDIVRLVRTRTEIRLRVHQAHAAVINAQNAFQLAQGELKSLEDEVQYLHSQCAQLEGRNAAPAIAPDMSNIIPMTGFAGISSEPTPPPRNFAPADGVNRAHAIREVL